MQPVADPLSPSYDAVFSVAFSQAESFGLKLGIRTTRQGLSSIDFVSPGVPNKAPTNKLARLACEQLLGYFTHAQSPFTIPLDPQGTPFQQRVWQALRNVPPGATRSYGALARELGTGARAVGNACRSNPLPIIIPCHRIVGAGYVPVAAVRPRRPGGSFGAGTTAPHPCHRIVAARYLGGYSGATSGGPVTLKRSLLDHEQGC